MDKPNQLDWPSLQVALKGQFIFAGSKASDYDEKGVLDADNIGGRVGLNVNRAGPIAGGNNPSGNFSQGGLFESWLSLIVEEGQDINLGAIGRVAMSSSLSSGFAPTAMPVMAGYSSKEELAAVPGVSPALANKIIAERKKQPFTGVDDFRARTGLSATEFNKFKDHLIIF